MKKNHSMFDRRGFIKRAGLFLPALIFMPKFGANPTVIELFNRDGSELIHVPRGGGLQAASTIVERTISSVVDRRIKLSNSNFARLWSTDLGTSWTKIRIGCRIGIEDSGSNITSTPLFAIGVCSGTTNIFQDATTTHWLGAITTDGTLSRAAGPPVNYADDDGLMPAKRVGSTTTNAAASLGGGDYNQFFCDCTTANRSALFIDITKGSPNFTIGGFFRSAAADNDVTLATYLAQLPLASPAATSHQIGHDRTLAIDEGTNGSFNAINIAWDRASPAIELSDIAVVKLA